MAGAVERRLLGLSQADAKGTYELLVATSTAGRYVNATAPQFGMVNDQTVDNSAAIQAAGDYALAHNIRIMRLPPWAIRIGTGCSWAQPLVIEGEYASEGYKVSEQVHKGGTVLLADSTSTNPVLEFDGGASNIFGPMLRNMMILGSTNFLGGTYSAFADRPALRLARTWTETRFENVFVSGFKRQGLKLESVQDGNFFGLTILNCGQDNVYGAISFGVSAGSGALNNCNALRFYGLHIEACPFMLQLSDNPHRHIYFDGKLEAGTPQAGTALSSLVQIPATVKEVDFKGQYVHRAADDLAIYPGGHATAPHFFTIQNESTHFDPSCQFTASPAATPGTSGAGAKWHLFQGQGGRIDGGEFDCFPGAFSLILGNNVRVAGPKLNTFRTTGGSTNLIQFTGNNAVVDQPTVYATQAGAATGGTLFSTNAGATGNRVRRPKYVGPGSFSNTLSGGSGVQATTYESDGFPDDPMGLGFAPNWLGLIAPSAVTWTAANDAIYSRVVGGGTLSKVKINVGVSSGNISVAVYARSGSGEAAVPGTRLITTGAIACPAAGDQVVDLGGSVVVHPGDFVCLTCDNTTASFMSNSGSDSTLYNGMAYRQAAAHPAPSAPASLTASNRRMPLLKVTA